MLTEDQVVNRTKWVTRRKDWLDLKPGELLQGVRKGMGLKKGEEIVKLAIIVVTDVRREALNRLILDAKYGFAETTAEGFPPGNPKHWPSEFVKMFLASHKGVYADSLITRIAFRYVPGGSSTR